MSFVLSLVWDIEKFLIPHEELNLRPWDSALQCSTTEPQRLCGEQGPLKSSCMTQILHIAKISNVDSIMFEKIMRKFVSLELGKEIHFMTFLSKGFVFLAGPTQHIPATHISNEWINSGS